MGQSGLMFSLSAEECGVGIGVNEIVTFYQSHKLDGLVCHLQEQAMPHGHHDNGAVRLGKHLPGSTCTGRLTILASA